MKKSVLLFASVAFAIIEAVASNLLIVFLEALPFESKGKSWLLFR